MTFKGTYTQFQSLQGLTDVFLILRQNVIVVCSVVRKIRRSNSLSSKPAALRHAYRHTTILLKLPFVQARSEHRLTVSLVFLINFFLNMIVSIKLSICK
jgi:hypothetical protein